MWPKFSVHCTYEKSHSRSANFLQFPFFASLCERTAIMTIIISAFSTVSFRSYSIYIIWCGTLPVVVMGSVNTTRVTFLTCLVANRPAFMLYLFVAHPVSLFLLLCTVTRVRGNSSIIQWICFVDGEDQNAKLFS